MKLLSVHIHHKVLTMLIPAGMEEGQNSPLPTFLQARSLMNPSKARQRAALQEKDPTALSCS